MLGLCHASICAFSGNLKLIKCVFDCYIIWLSNTSSTVRCRYSSLVKINLWKLVKRINARWIDFRRNDFRWIVHKPAEKWFNMLCNVYNNNYNYYKIMTLSGEHSKGLKYQQPRNRWAWSEMTTKGQMGPLCCHGSEASLWHGTWQYQTLMPSLIAAQWSNQVQQLTEQHRARRTSTRGWPAPTSSVRLP